MVFYNQIGVKPSSSLMDFGKNIKALLFLYASIFSNIKAMAAVAKQTLFKIFNALNAFNWHSAFRF